MKLKEFTQFSLCIVKNLMLNHGVLINEIILLRINGIALKGRKYTRDIMTLLSIP